CASTGVTLSAHTSLACWPIYKFGTEEQKQKYLRPMAEGKKIGAFGLTESSAGSDAGSIRTTAIRDGNHYVLNGAKLFITNALVGETYVVFATTDRSKGHKGITAFIVEKGTPGFSFGKKEKKLGIRASTTVELIFEDCRVPVENRLGEEGQGFYIAMQTLDGGRTGIAAQALGIAQGALEQAISYAKQRYQFGQPIANFQAIQFYLADMATKVEAARLLTYQAAWFEDNGLPYSIPSSMAKLYASEVAMEVTVK
ncbi:MAG: acyl-CoA dehydrogenase family protein, partial [Clostridia bacterium]|nr:acyl-CoA dehydrogenase family protein [Clostridia bacterium]